MRPSVVIVMAAGISAASGATARDLTPEIRAQLLAPTLEVELAKPVVTLPLRGTDHRGFYRCPYLQVRVNGRGPFTFLFDTGSGYTLVSDKVVKAARVPVVFDRGGTRDLVRLGKLTVGGVTLRNVWAVHDDDFGVDGIIGFRAFGSMNLVFDLAAQRLTVARAPVALAGAFELPYETPFNVPTIALVIEGKPVRTLIDTGDDAFAWEMRKVELGDAAMAHPPLPAESVLNGANVQPTMVTSLTAPLRMGPVQAEHPVVAVNDSLPVGDIGVDVIRQFRMEFVPGRRVVLFQPLFAGGSFVVDGNRTPGFKLAFDGKGTVSGVVPGSAAERAGLATGAVVLAIDGMPGAGITPRSWDAALAKTQLAVRWRNKEGEHTTLLAVEKQR
jgi:hypothetical protein